MSGDTPLIVFAIIAAIGLVALAGVLWVATTWRRERQRARLERGFERARKVEKSGSGIQGTPYSVYGSSSCSDGTRPKR